MTYVSPKSTLSRKITRRGLNKPLGSPNPLSIGTHGGTHGGASGSGISIHGLSTRDHKKKLPPHEQKKKTHGLRLSRNYPQPSFDKD